MKKQSRIDEKTVRILSCAVAVGVMIVLLSGDIFISQFIRINPNQEYTEQENLDTRKEETSNESNTTPSGASSSDYDVEFMNQLSLPEAYDKIEKKETVLVLAGRSTCAPCKRFVPVLKTVYSELNITDGVYLDQTKINPNTERYQEFVNLSNTISENFGGTPFFMIFQDGKLVDYILGMNPNVDLKAELINKIQNVVK